MQNIGGFDVSILVAFMMQVVGAYEQPETGSVLAVL